LFILMLGAGTVFAQQPTTTTSGSTDSSKTVKIAAEVVSADSDARTITVRPADNLGMTGSTGSTGTSGSTGSATAIATTKTLTVDAKAAASLKSVKFGDKVTLTCRSDMSGAGSSSYGTSGSTGVGTGTTGSTGTGASGSTGTGSSYGSTGSQDFATNCASVTLIQKATTGSNPQQ
jgi:hypothetical protein